MLVDPAGVPQVALDFINEDHAEETRLLNDLAEQVAAQRDGRGTASDVRAALERLLLHTRDHFAREEAAMRASGFPAYRPHKAEHERVLSEMECEVRHYGAVADAERLWRYASQAVPKWFMDHIRTMDAVTAQYVAAQQR